MIKPHSKTRLVIVMFVIVLLLMLFKLRTIRPLELMIVDAESNEPLENIIVQSQIMTAGLDKYWGIIPKIDPIEYKFKRVDTFHSNSEGIVTIPRRIYYVDLYERIYQEIVQINLKTIKSDNDEQLILPYTTPDNMINHNRDYIGLKICNLAPSVAKYSPGKMVSDKSVDYKIIRNESSLGKRKKSMVIKLEKRIGDS
jgi:hypothetical protein